MSTWIVANGRWTQEQMDSVARKLHNHVCSSFDGGEQNRISPAGPMESADRIRHEAQICAVIGALEGNGFKVIEADHKDTTESHE